MSSILVFIFIKNVVVAIEADAVAVAPASIKRGNDHASFALRV
jgi:hypothetical protein